MDSRIAMQRTLMYKAMRETYPLYFGDPLELRRSQLSGFDGTAYGQRNGGGAGLIGAVLAVATGGASLGFTTLASTLSTISVVGSVVGAVTGNKTFSTIGAMAGLGATFMNLSSAGTFGKEMQSWAADTNTSIMGSGATQTAAPVENAVVKNISETGVTGADTVTQATAGGSNSVSAADTLSQANLADDSGMLAPADGGASVAQSIAGGAQPEGLIGDTSGMLAPADGSLPAYEDPLKKVTIDGDPASNVYGKDGGSQALKIANNDSSSLMSRVASPEKTAAAVKLAQEPATGTSLWDKISKFTEKNQTLTAMALHGVASAYQSPAQKNLYASQSALYDAKANEINTQMANANAIPTVTGMKVNKGVQVYNPKPVVSAPVISTGLIQTRSA